MDARGESMVGFEGTKRELPTGTVGEPVSEPGGEAQLRGEKCGWVQALRPVRVRLRMVCGLSRSGWLLSGSLGPRVQPSGYR